MSRILVLSCFLIISAPALAQVCQAPGSPVDGSVNACTDFRVLLLDIGPIEPGFDITDEGWVWVARSHPGATTACVSGVVNRAGIASNDTPANHYSHDGVVHVDVDPGQERLLSNINGPNNGDLDNDLVPDDDGQTIPPREIEIEWETGILPTEKSGDGADPIYPKWVWPSVGDRVWADGNWVFDCGHGKKIGHFEPNPIANQPPVFVGREYFRSEIHPARALASMRRQVGTLPGSGSTPVPIVATDLYIHGRGGYVTDILNCGMDIILEGADEDGDGEGDGDPFACPVKTTPIDRRFQFEICLPPRPHPAASLKWIVEPGPGDTVPAVAPEILEGPASAGCGNDGDDARDLYDRTTSLLVTIPLDGTSVAATEVYARRIRAGWVFPDAALRHLTVTLQQMDLHNDTDDVPTDTGELTFMFLNLNRARDAWTRLSDWDIPTHDSCGALCFEHTNTMNDYDDDGSCCNGLLNFSGPTYDFYMAGGDPFTIRAEGYDQDCYDFFDDFEGKHLSLGLYVFCHTLDITEYGGNDSIATLPSRIPGRELETTFGPPDYGVGFRDLHAWKDSSFSEYELEFMVAEIPLGAEDQADLSVTKTCEADGEVALVGEPFHCTIAAANAGPGLPRQVVIDDTLTGAGGAVLGAASLTVGGSDAFACSVTGPASFTCDPGTVPVGGVATVTLDVTARTAGLYVNAASAATDSTDTSPGNDAAEATIDVFLPITIDIKPGTPTNPVTPTVEGSIPVAILTTPTFDATSVDAMQVCFGDSDAPAERDCSLRQKKEHRLDVDRDGDIDLLLHFDVTETGIDVGDDRACLIGRTIGGIGVYGCDAVSTLTPR